MPAVIPISLSVDRFYLREILKALICSILFHRSFHTTLPREAYLESCDLYYCKSSDPLIMEQVDEKLALFISLLDQGKSKGNVILSFFEKRSRKGWFALEEVPWEEWVITVIVTRAATQREQITSLKTLSKDVGQALSFISLESGRQRDHIPPIVNSQAFPFTISHQLVATTDPGGWTVSLLSNLLPTSP
jgi:autophagy-related protein 101